MDSCTLYSEGSIDIKSLIGVKVFDSDKKQIGVVDSANREGNSVLAKIRCDDDSIGKDITLSVKIF